MIELPGGLAINADSQCYALGKPVERTDKNGKTSVVMQNASYYTTLAGAVEGAIARLVREGVADGELLTPGDAWRKIDTLRSEIADLLADIDV